MAPKRLYVIVEGQTEEEFVKQVLSPYFQTLGIYDTRAILLKTGTTPEGKKASGGAVKFQRYKKLAEKLLKGEKDIVLTSLIDLFRLSSDFPCYQEVQKANISSQKKAERLEECLSQEINNPRFFPYIQVHEFEALVFAGSKSALLEIAKALNLSPETVEKELDKILKKYPNPEDINNHPNTAPSKRLEKLLPGYKKVLHGNLIIKQNGISRLIERCPHFAQWIEKLENELKK